MDVNKILGADFLDILFEGKNKLYGAYELRKTYQKRLQTALLSTLGFVAFVFILAFVSDKISGNGKGKVKVQDVTLEDIKQEEEKKVEPPPPPPPPKQEPPKIEMQKFTPPKIVEPEEFEEKNEVKEQEEITNVSTTSQEGIKDEEYVDPPKVEEETKTVEAPVVKPPELITDAERMAQPDPSWNSYLKRTIERSVDELTEDGQAGTCKVLFTVALDGSVSEVEALTMKGTVLARVAVDAVRKGPKWKPGRDLSGNPIPSKRVQPVVFVLEEE